MVTIDASNMSSKNLNKKIRELAHEVETITVINPQAQHNIAVALFACITINIEGSVGYFAGSMGDGPQITIEGNAGWALGENMMSGKIVVRKDAGASAASTIRGGEVFIGGNAGARAGISMKGGSLVIQGNAGFLTGFMMQKGRIIVCGDVGDAVGDSMYEGVIYVGGEIASTGSDAIIEDATEDELIEVWNTLDGYSIKERPRFRKIVSEKKLYHFDDLERLEKNVI